MKKTEYKVPYTKLTESETIIYERLYDDALIHLKAVTDSDSFILSCAAIKFNLAAEAKKSIEENGTPLHTFESGIKQVSPEYTVLKTMAKEGCDLLDKAGLTPKARKDLKEEVEAKKHENKMAKLLGMKTETKKVN